MPVSAAAASSARRRQEIGTKIVRSSGEIVRGGEKTGRSAKEGSSPPRPHRTSSRRHSSQQSSAESGSRTTAGITAASSAGRQSHHSHHPYAVTGGSSPPHPPSVVSNASAASAGSSASDRMRKNEGNRIRKLIKKRGFGFGGNKKSNKKGGLSSSSNAAMSYVEWATGSVGDGMPKKRSLNSWKDDVRMDDGSGGNEGGAVWASSAPRESLPRTARLGYSSSSQQSSGVIRHSKSTNDISDLEVLALTVQTINAALRASVGPDAAAKSVEAQPYMLSGAKFQPKGCVWDVSIKVSDHCYREEKSRDSIMIALFGHILALARSLVHFQIMCNSSSCRSCLHRRLGSATTAPRGRARVKNKVSWEG